jgi:hypothetical protein
LLFLTVSRRLTAIALTAAIALACSSSALPLAMARPAAGPASTPGCPSTSYADSAALLQALQGASYTCAEAIAAALGLRADRATADALLAMAAGGSNSLARRNGLRALGRLAEAPRGSRARELVLRLGAAQLQTLLHDILATERDTFLVQDAIWLLDTSFYPSFSAAAGLERAAADSALAPDLRYRAALARARLVYARGGRLWDSDAAFILGGLRSPDPGVRAAAAGAAARLRSDQLTPELRATLETALAAAWESEPPLALAPDAPRPALARIVESTPTSLTARAAIARARDRLTGGAHLDGLRAAYEALALPHHLTGEGVELRGERPEALPALLAEVARVRAALMAALGPELATPIPSEGEAPLRIMVFSRQGVYRDYMRAFTPLPVDVDGTYDEATATLYTHERTAAQSENTLAETLRHELTHHLTSRALFPGSWLSPGYHTEPKGWLDEGLAELMAGLGPDGAPGPRTRQLARLCARTAPTELAGLLARREGYDRFGSFDYEAAWALSAYLLAERPDGLRRIAAAYRDGTYRLRDWSRLAGAPLAEVEAEWHWAIERWCEGSAA